MTHLSTFKQQELDNFKSEHPDLPYPESFFRKVDMYNDKTANGLTKMIIRWAKVNGYYARRISVEGRMIDGRKIVTDHMGFQRQIGTVSRVHSSMVKGSADISMVGPGGKTVEIEVKIGKDRRSDAQVKYQQRIEKAGGVYIIARSFEQFVESFNSIFNNQ